MIVYNVGRLWFAKKENAEKLRVSRGLKPSATLTVEVTHRNDLVALLNALCNPPLKGEPAAPATVELIERAVVSPHIAVPDCVPVFLLKDGK